MSLKEKFQWSNDPIYLIDGSSFLYRAFYAYPDLSRSDNFPTNALYITIRLILKIIREEDPKYCCFVLDGRGPTFRQQIMESYKAQRLRMPESLSMQISPLLSGLDLLGIPKLIAEDGEADDYISSLAQKFKKSFPVVIIGSDKDFYQCLDHNVILWDPAQKKEKIITLNDFKNEYALIPSQWPDFQALIGDTSDNIPGVPGIGPKTALTLLHNYTSIEELKKNLDKLEKKNQDKLSCYLDKIVIYRKLVELKTDLCPEINPKDLVLHPADYQKLAHFFQEYEFKTLLKDLPINSELKNRPFSSSDKIQKVKTQKSPQSESLILKQKEIGLVSTKDGHLIGYENQEILSQSPLEKLFSWVHHANKIFLPSLKGVLQSAPLWKEIPLKHYFDLSLGAYLLDPEERVYSWTTLLQKYLPEINVHRENEGLAALKIGKLIQQRLQAAGLINLMYEIEMPLIPVLVDMEKRGIRIDLNKFKDFLQEVEQEIKELTHNIYAHAGIQFNLRSAQQLAEILFKRLKLKPSQKTPGGKPSTANFVLESLQNQHPIIYYILKFRSLEKLRSTYLEPLPKLVDKNWRLHTQFNQLATATGRLSSSNPNLQNIPIRGEFGSRLRFCFVASKGKYLVAADYSQIELRILAHMSQDLHLLEAFNNNEDIHTRTASLLFEKDQNQITSDERRKAKTINFGLLYGMGPLKLGRETGLGLHKAKEFIRIYFSKLSQVSDFYSQVETTAKTHGFVTTIAGRRRLLKDINSKNANLAQQAKRMAINTVVQGSAADIIKMAMIKVDNDSFLKDLQAELILQIHDELLLEVPKENAQEAGEQVSRIMSNIFPLSLPLNVEWGIGNSWAEAH